MTHSHTSYSTLSFHLINNGNSGGAAEVYGQVATEFGFDDNVTGAALLAAHAQPCA
jgi:hypothetical protein